MDLDSDYDYYSSRCKDINGLWLFKGTFMTFVGGHSDHQTLLYFNVKELLQFWGGGDLKTHPQVWSKFQKLVRIRSRGSIQ
jgi:hypothetical protein